MVEMEREVMVVREVEKDTDMGTAEKVTIVAIMVVKVIMGMVIMVAITVMMGMVATVVDTVITDTVTRAAMMVATLLVLLALLVVLEALRRRVVAVEKEVRHLGRSMSLVSAQLRSTSPTSMGRGQNANVTK
jgi:protein-S-isoprenylcysteine O-methyltransferase Ste14